MNFSNTPSFISHGPRPGLRLTLAVAASVALLVGDARLGLMGPAREALSVALYPLQWLVNAPISAAQHASEFFVDQARLKQENAALKTRELQLSAKLAELTTVKNELAELKAMHALRSQRAEKSVLAEVLYTGRDPFSYKLIIDKGQNAGLVEGQPVVGDSGLIGQVTRVQPLTAEVTLVINKGQMVPVMVERTGVRAILYGYGGGVELRYLPVHADLKAGDTLVTSGIDGVYPAGLPVSRVTHVERRAGAAFLSASSLPVDGVYRQRFVLALETGANRPPVTQPQP
ncbi:rod shape-determining protein MreC [Crenobacter luteus]|uniref:Cell shape-determining protein MreC n=1 Tax=Crenobacter luteus TaxID=1452487 RepID=A0A161S3V2_9NEIS|nr:rod shape-determining protein MreC [Crenobacter luteus]KZE24953.1 rod shape-determining protein MreC [Crenobacter luteus]TCP15126.1 rod shape-determining protein MreC [Crenobacter luteus]